MLRKWNWFLLLSWEYEKTWNETLNMNDKNKSIGYQNTQIDYKSFQFNTSFTSWNYSRWTARSGEKGKYVFQIVSFCKSHIILFYSLKGVYFDQLLGARTLCISTSYRVRAIPKFRSKYMSPHHFMKQVFLLEN